MWIRTQDKMKLSDCNRLSVWRTNECKNNEYSIINQFNYTYDADDYETLGLYESKERALQVLNLIQNALFQGTKLDYITSGGVRHYRDKVFEMPQE